MSKRSVVLLLQDIQEAVQNILDYTKGLSFEDFLNDSKTKDAVVRNFEIIGESSNKYLRILSLRINKLIGLE